MFSTSITFSFHTTQKKISYDSKKISYNSKKNFLLTHTLSGGATLARVATGRALRARSVPARPACGRRRSAPPSPLEGGQGGVLTPGQGVGPRGASSFPPSRGVRGVVHAAGDGSRLCPSRAPTLAQSQLVGAAGRRRPSSPPRRRPRGRRRPAMVQTPSWTRAVRGSRPFTPGLRLLTHATASIDESNRAMSHAK